MDLKKFFSPLTHLSRQEKQLCQDFAKQPEVSRLLSVFRMLKQKDSIQEAFVLLTWGVKKYPDYLPARIQLAHMLYDKGLIQDAWTCLSMASSQTLSENHMGQKLRLRLAVLLGMESLVNQILNSMENSGLRDAETTRLKEVLRSGGIRSACQLLIGEFQKKGKELFLPESGTSPAGGLPEKILHGKTPAFPSVPDVPEALLQDPGLKGFYVVPLAELFAVSSQTEQQTTSESPLDSPTIAEIYFNQGLYQKAGQVYQNLLRLSPGNEAWKLRLREIRQQLYHDKAALTEDTALIHKQEVLGHAQRQARFYQNMLEKLQ
ncbi:MAG: hypothetical protein H6618_04160 [Deltaproteobacteria bacterium]|nr:hypothetical protein [Deltaproteobacteria bacterium]